MVLVSVVIPVYNQGEFVRAAIDSVVRQTFRNFEIVVVDDGSTDRTPEVLSGYGSAITVVRQENRGPAGAVNTGIRNSHGDWVGFLAADDLWEPTKLEKEIEAIRSNPTAGLVYSDYTYVDAAGRVLSREHFPLPNGRRKTILRLFRRCFVNGCTVLIRRDILERAGLWDEELRMGEDWDMWLRASMVCDFAYVPESLARYRLHGEQASSKRDLMERASRRVASRNMRRLSAGFGAYVATRGIVRQLRSFPAFLRASVGHRRTVRRQMMDLVEWMAILVNPDFHWMDGRGTRAWKPT